MLYFVKHLACDAVVVALSLWATRGIELGALTIPAFFICAIQKGLITLAIAIGINVIFHWQSVAVGVKYLKKKIKH